MNSHKLKTSQLRALLAVAHCGNFSEAALQLEMSQSAVSHAIASLESDLGVTLLVRGRQGAALTPVGQDIVGDARRVFDALEAIGRKAQLARGLDRGEVRIASFRSMSMHVLPKAIARFQHKHPALGVSITELFGYPEVEAELQAGRADVGFTYLPTGDEFDVCELLRDEYVVLVSDATARKLPPVITPDCLLSHPLISTPSNCGCRILLDRHFHALGLTFRPNYEVKEDSTIASMVAQGLGVALIPRLAIEPVPAGVQLLRLSKPIERIVGLAMLSEVDHPPPVYAFWEAVVSLKPMIAELLAQFPTDASARSLRYPA